MPSSMNLYPLPFSSAGYSSLAEALKQPAVGDLVPYLLETQQPFNLLFEMPRMYCVDPCYHAPLPSRYPLALFPLPFGETRLARSSSMQAAAAEPCGTRSHPHRQVVPT